MWGAVCVACVLVSALALRVVFYMTGISIYPVFLERRGSLRLVLGRGDLGRPSLLGRRCWFSPKGATLVSSLD